VPSSSSNMPKTQFSNFDFDKTIEMCFQIYDYNFSPKDIR
jgi:hypothetical protein